MAHMVLAPSAESLSTQDAWRCCRQQLRAFPVRLNLQVWGDHRAGA